MNSEPLTQVGIEIKLMRLLEDLEEKTEDFEFLSVKAGEAEASFKVAWAKKYLASEGSIRQREAIADVAVGDAFENHKIAEALMKSGRERLTTLRTMIDALRTLNANVRAQV